MTSIFYDLETTDTRPVGQILNYSFLGVDKNLKLRDESSGEVRISRTQLPRAGAILANRVNVEEHQERAHHDEVSGMREVQTYIGSQIEKAKGRIPLIGYNSSRFDLPYLRTSLIRSGFSPYFGGKIVPRDLFHVVQKLSATNSDFPRSAAAGKPVKEGEGPRLSLKLEHIARHFGLLDGPQSHFSRDDALVTIKLSETLLKKFGLDVRNYDAYEVAHLHHAKNRGVITSALFPNYDLQSDQIAVAVPFALLDFGYNSALWINLERYEKGEGARSIQWFSSSTGLFIQGKSDGLKEKWSAVAEKALSEFKNVRLDNYFQRSTCDIEQDIYRIHANGDFSGLDALGVAIHQGSEDALKRAKNRDARILYLRYLLNSYHWGGGDDARFEGMLREYALYRYGGKMRLSKFDPETEYQAGVYSEHYHETLGDMQFELEELAGTAQKADRPLLEALGRFYSDSDIYRLAGPELERIGRRLLNKAA